MCGRVCVVFFILDWFCQRNTKPCRSRERSDLFMFMPVISFQWQKKGGLNLHMYNNSKHTVCIFLHDFKRRKEKAGTNKDVLSYPARCFSFLSSIPSLDTSLLNTKMPITMLTCHEKGEQEYLFPINHPQREDFKSNVFNFPAWHSP